MDSAVDPRLRRFDHRVEESPEDIAPGQDLAHLNLRLLVVDRAYRLGRLEDQPGDIIATPPAPKTFEWFIGHSTSMCLTKLTDFREQRVKNFVNFVRRLSCDIVTEKPRITGPN